jgi:hypothetical protein
MRSCLQTSCNGVGFNMKRSFRAPEGTYVRLPDSSLVAESKQDVWAAAMVVLYVRTDAAIEDSSLAAFSKMLKLHPRELVCSGQAEASAAAWQP